MSERTSYTPGTPCWVDLATPDIEAAAQFYGDLLGWDVPEQPNSAEMGGYRRAKKNGKDVAGMMPLMQEGQPPVWSTHVAVADADATAKTVADAGGTVIAEPMDVMDLGRMAIFTDPTGAVFEVWQADTFPGAELVNEYGCFGWNELGTRDIDSAKSFYGQVFGWTTDERPAEEIGTYYVWKQGEDRVGGMMDIGPILPAEIPAHWLVYFTVENCDAAVEQVQSAGGSLNSGPMDVEVGRFAVVSDPFGAVFAVMQPSEGLLAEAP
ncbi:MAG TPA: VOC family protein [Solirubrobacterales bacterium]|nr:VOC family protein [Solirubrobacterales bacterium]